jgi:hypothetical protein
LSYADEEENRFMAKRQTLDEKAEQDGHMGERERDEDDEVLRAYDGCMIYNYV